MIRLISGFSLNNLSAGLIVATVALPLCIAFAIASGASPMAGIVSGVVGGAIAALFGSSRFQVSGPAAAFITVIAGIIASHGLPVLLAATLGAGLLGVAPDGGSRQEQEPGPDEAETENGSPQGEGRRPEGGDAA